MTTTPFPSLRNLGSYVTILRPQVIALKASANRFAVEILDVVDELEATRLRAEQTLAQTAHSKYQQTELANFLGVDEDEQFADPYIEALDFLYDVTCLCRDVLRCTEEAVERKRRMAYYKTVLDGLENKEENSEGLANWSQREEEQAEDEATNTKEDKRVEDAGAEEAGLC